MSTQDTRAPQGREQAWRSPDGDAPAPGRLVAVTDNPIGRAVVAIGEIAGRRTTLLADEGVEHMPVQWLAEHPLDEADAVVLCDHDTPEMEGLLRAALDGKAGYVAMMGSRRRAEMVFAMLDDLPEETLQRLRVPAGLNTGGKLPGEIALSVVAEVIAWCHGRDGGPMKR